MNRTANPVSMPGKGNVIDFANDTAADIAVGSVIPFVNFCGVAETDIPIGETGAIRVEGIWDVTSVNTAINMGDLVYWNATDGKATGTATGNVPLGVAVAPKASGKTVLRVKIGFWMKP